MKPSSVVFLIIIGLLSVVTLILGFGAYENMQKESVEEVVAQVIIPVHVTEIATGTVEDIVYVTGFVEPSARVDVIAKIPTPGKLIEAKVKKGDRVKKNQILATVDRDEVGAIYLAYGVKAPRSGIVASIIDDKGALITPQVPVATIININKVLVMTSVIEADLGRVKEGIGARVRVDAYPERVFKGKITRIEPVLDPFSHTATVEITISNSDHSLLPGMFTRIELVTDEHSDVPVIGKNMLLKREGKDLAFVVKEKTKNNKTIMQIELTELELGYYDLGQYEILSGVELGDKVVDQDILILKDKTLVSISNLEGNDDETKDSDEKPADK